MTDFPHNPFVFPGMNPEGAGAAGNPLLASMEMMRKAWADLAGPGGLAQSLPMAAPLSVEDLDRRIGELRSVENWLRMNLSMLSSTIQGMEVQRATIATLRSFVDNASAQATRGASYGEASPLDVVLGLKPAPARPPATDDGAPAGRGAPSQDGAGLSPTTWFGAERAAGRAVSSAEPAAGLGVGDASTAETPSNTAAEAPTDADAAAADPQAMAQSMGNAAQAASAAWWNLLQHQFGQLAAATAASMPGYGAADAAGAPDGGQPSARAERGPRSGSDTGHETPRSRGERRDRRAKSGFGGGEGTAAANAAGNGKRKTAADAQAIGARKSAGQVKAANPKKKAANPKQSSERAQSADRAKPQAQAKGSSTGAKPGEKAPSSAQTKPAAKAKSAAQTKPAAKRATAAAGQADSRSQPAVRQGATGARAARRSLADKAAPSAAKNARV